MVLVPALTSASVEPTLLGLFRHELVKTSKCSFCGSSSDAEEVDNVLRIRFEGDTTLDQILKDTTFGNNLIPGKHCDSCNSSADTDQIVHLETSPDILVLQLVRFNANGSKNMARVSFTEHLDLTRFTVEQKYGDIVSTHYRLASVVHHQGTMNGGHYICVTKNPAGLWNEVNDITVGRNVGIGAALDPKDDFTPYLLFYVRHHPYMPRIVRELE